MRKRKRKALDQPNYAPVMDIRIRVFARISGEKEPVFHVAQKNREHKERFA